MGYLPTRHATDAFQNSPKKSNSPHYKKGGLALQRLMFRLNYNLAALLGKHPQKGPLCLGTELRAIQ